jgi:hypothetical protein
MTKSGDDSNSAREQGKARERELESEGRGCAGARGGRAGRGCAGGVLTVVQAAAERWRDDDEERRRLELSTRAGEGERENSRAKEKGVGCSGGGAHLL